MPGTLLAEAIPDAAIPSLAKLWHDGWHAAHDPLVPPYDPATRSPERFEHRLRHARSFGRMLRSDAGPVGLCLIDGNEISQLFVTASARRSGVGRTLLADAESRILRSGHDAAWLTVVRGNDVARQFYEKQGWRNDGVLAIDIETPSGPDVLDLWRLAKALIA